MIVDRLERDWTAPPYDALAEAIVLWGLLHRPASIADYDPEPYLVFPEHRLVLAAIKRTYAADPGRSWGHFYIAWMDECERLRPGQGMALVHLLDDGVFDDESRWMYRDSEKSRAQGMGMGDSRHDFLWWWKRLKDVSESRQVIGKLHGAVDLAWRGDVTGARRAVESIQAPARAPIRIDV